MSETNEIEEEGLLDTSTIPEGREDAGNIVDHGRVFVPASGIKANDLAQTLYLKHTADKYPGYAVSFFTDHTRNRVKATIICLDWEKLV